MRLWHKYLISCLPRQQLLGQWRECCLIAKNIKEKGTPNHILVNKIMEYPIDHFAYYTYLVYWEMLSRGYTPDLNKFCFTLSNLPYYKNLFKDWHNDQYLRQCYYNLQEKHDCGGITDKEWHIIETKFGSSIQ